MCVVAVVAFVSCRSSSETAPSTAGSAGSAAVPPAPPALSCKSVAEHVAAVVIAQTEKPGIQFVGPEAAPVILRVVAARCDQDRWSEDAKGCYLAMADTNGWPACDAKLTGEQLAKVQAEIGAARDAGRADNGSGAQSTPPTPPTVERSLPWIDRAEKVLPTLLDGTNGSLVATAIQTITHSQGNKPRLKTYEIRRMGDRISLRVSINFEAAVLRDSSGNPVVYTTDVIWDFSEQGHVSAKVTADNATWGPGGAKQLDDWFRNEFYPSLYRAAG